MPRKKSKEDKQQPKLMEWAASEQSHTLSAAERQEQLEREFTKLVKVRREIESRRLEEERIIKRIIRLHIDEDRQRPEADTREQEE